MSGDISLCKVCDQHSVFGVNVNDHHENNFIFKVPSLIMASLRYINLKGCQMEFSLLVSWLLLSWGVGALASSRGRSGGGYFLLSFFASPIVALIVVLVIKNINEENKKYFRAAHEHEMHLESIKAIARSNSSNNPSNDAVKSLSVADELSKLAALKEKGLLTEEEFFAQKQRLLANS